MKKTIFLFLIGVLACGCAHTPDFSKYSNSQLSNDYRKTLFDIRYRQETYNTDTDKTNPYNSKKVAELKERLSLIRDEMMRRGVPNPF